MYSLKNIRKIRGLEGAGVTASIYRDAMRIGWVQVPADGGRALFTFDADGERGSFERFVEGWWSAASSRITLDPLATEFATSDPGFALRLPAKMRYWVMAWVAGTPVSRLEAAA
jgi:hypothetical protein